MKAFRLGYSEYDSVFDLITEEHDIMIFQMYYGLRRPFR